MAFTSRDKCALAAVVAGSLAIRLLFAFFVQPTPVSDFGWYLDHALAIAHGRGYTTNGFATAYWPPGWPYFLAAEIVLFGKSLLAVEWIQALLNALTAGVVYVIAHRLAGTGAAVAAGIAYALLPSAVEWSAVLGSEPLYTLLWVAVAYIWMTRSPSDLRWMGASGFLLGAAALVRPSALFSWVVLGAYLACLKQRKAYARILVALVITVFCASVAIAPVAVRNYRVFHKFVPVSNNGGVTFYLANNDRPGRHDLGGSPKEDQIASLIRSPRTEVEGNEIAAHAALRFIASHPLREARLLVWEVKQLYQGDHGAVAYTMREIQSPPSSERVAKIAAFDDAVYYVLMVASLVGFILFCRRETDEDPGWRLLAGMILYNTVLYAIFGGNDRYRYPTMPFFAVFAGFAIVAGLSYARSRFIERLSVRARA